MFGVLLALMINDYRAEKKQDKIREKNLEIVKIRTTMNLESLKSVVSSHESLMKELENAKNDSLSIFQVLNLINGCQVPLLKLLSPETFSNNTDDLNLVILLEEIKISKELMKDSQEDPSDLVSSNVHNKEKKLKERLAVNIKFHLHLENEMIQTYENLLDFIEN